MEVSTYSRGMVSSMDFTNSSLAARNDMDIDMDIDLGPEGPLAEIAADGPTEAGQTDGNLSILSTPDSDQLVPHKVHLRGVNDLNTANMKDFAAEHYPSDTPIRIEWIDDNSANLVYNSPALALKALTSFSSVDPSTLPTLQLRPAKPLPTHPRVALQVRLAIFSDQKKPRAYEASRFYLMHPEHDPRERKKRQERANKSYGNDHGDYRKRRYDKGEQRRRRHGDDGAGYDASMYDDDRSTVTARDEARSGRQGSFSSYSSQDEHRKNRSQRVRYIRSSAHDEDIFSEGNNAFSSSQLRDRSASPERQNFGYKDGALSLNRSNRRQGRERTPLPKYRSDKSSTPSRNNNGKELFPSQSPSKMDISAELRGSTLESLGKELFPDQTAPATLKKTFFPHKTSISNHRRSDAFDAADETADLFANGMSVPFTDGAMDRPSPSRSLEDRVARAPLLSYGRLKDSISTPSAGTSVAVGSKGFSIRGVAQQQDQGFSIRGAAGSTSTNGDIRELFPGKFGDNAGKELFSEKLEGRGGRRRKAEDMFY
ncbi:MAG: hypothetical protein M1830_008397 [Pleopsidium flavum]|nr:MAG: hypothetical protein M1830_008397 [Pleopsidium flavum]